MQNHHAESPRKTLLLLLQHPHLILIPYFPFTQFDLPINEKLAPPLIPLKPPMQSRRRKHRGKRKSMQTSVDLKLLHTNPRGWVSKRAAILDVINSVQPDYVNINETQSRGENKVHIKGYNCFSKNRKEMAGGQSK